MDSKHNETVEGLISRLTHSMPVVRRDALREVRGLAEVDPQIVAAVRVLSATDRDSMVRETAAVTLSSLGMSPASSDELDLEPQTRSRSRATADAGLEQINLLTEPNDARPAGLEVSVAKLEFAVDDLRRRMASMEEEFADREGLPDTNLLSQSFVSRALAVWGHHAIASIIVSIPLILIYVLVLAVLFAG